MAASYQEKLAKFDEVLQAPKIDVDKLCSMCFTGVPDTRSGTRSLTWKLMLNYLPPCREDWKTVLEKQRALYKQFLEEMIIQPGADHLGDDRKDVTFEDHPLSTNSDSQWSQYFKDNDVLLQIDKDTRRLQPDIGFFQQATEFPSKALQDAANNIETLRKRVEHTMLQSSDVAKNRLGINITKCKNMKFSPADFGHEILPEGQEAHWEVLERILFIYAKLNPGQSYVQGMNEIIGPVYYVMARDPDAEWREHAEADTFFCFTNLMSQIRDNFIKSLDDSPEGINAKMIKLMLMIKKCDIKVWLRFQEQDLKMEFFSFRWLTLLLSQEFPLPDLIRVWDSLLSDEKRPQFLICVCCAMIVLQRNAILTNDFPSNIKMLQNYPVTDVHVILRKAIELKKYL